MILLPHADGDAGHGAAGAVDHLAPERSAGAAPRR